MNTPSDDKQANDFLLTFADLTNLFKKNKNKIRNSAIFFALIAICYGLTKPVEYEAEATFKEKGKSQSGVGSSLSEAFFLMSDGADSNALTIMRSRKLIEDLIKDQGLQGVVTKHEHRFPFISLQAIKNNLLIEYALLKKLSAPILNAPTVDLKIQEISYKGEIPTNLQIKVLSEEKFGIYDPHSKKYEEGFFGQPFSDQHYSFTLVHANPSPINQGEYSIVLLPLEQTAKTLSKQFTVETDRSDKSLLKITYKNADRHLASTNINALMALYQKYIQCEHEKICEKQISYLVQRQKEMAKVLETMMQAHADELSSDLSTTGFATSEKAMEFLATSQYQLKQKLFTLNLEIQRLQKTKGEGHIDNDVYSSLSHLDVINKIATEKRLLKQQADSLDLVLRNIPAQSEEFKESFPSQLNDLDEIKQTLKESLLTLTSLEKNQIPPLYPKLVENSKYIVDAWHERLVKSKNNLDAHPSKKACVDNWEQCKKGFISNLLHLNHYLNVYQRNIEERLAHQQAPVKEFQGINLNIAKDLYISYNKDLSAVESQKTQHEFILTQLNEPTFEVSSLSTVLSDPLSLEMISRATNLILALKDQDNRSSKEQERLNADLAIQKGFLKTHIQQSISLLALRQKFLKEKIQRLQSMNLSLIQEEISILENQINEYGMNTLENLLQERELIENNLAELRIEMAAFPQKWAAEQMINQQMEINKKLVEEVSKLVESKNIANNLEKLQSAPIDIAFPPIHPKSPRLLFLAIIGAAAGAFLSFIWTLGNSIITGVQASSSSLKAAGQYVCGSLSRNYSGSFDEDPLLDSDLATLRRLIAFVEPSSEDNTYRHLANTLLLLEGKGPNYTPSLAELLSRKGRSILVLELRFEEMQEIDTAGILQYLEGKIHEPPIVHLPRYDKISSGGICRYGNELIGSQRFKDLLTLLAKQYEWIIISSSASPKSAEAESLLDLFSFAAVSVTGESMENLRSYIQHAKNPKNKIAFILCEQPSDFKGL